MRFKVDENLHSDCAELLNQHGHDSITVFDEVLRGYRDGELAAVCQRETRALLTLDLDFAEILDFPPGEYAGIVVLRLNDQSRPAVLGVLGRIMPLFRTEPLSGHLWIVDEHQVRVRGSGREIP